MVLSLLNGIYQISPRFLKIHFKNLYSKLMMYLTPYILNKFSKDTSKIRNLYDAIDFAYSFRSFTFSIKPCQIKYEITKLMEFLTDLKPKVILEIGTAEGGTLFLFTNQSELEATIISVDLPEGPFGGGYPEWKIHLYQAFAKQGIKMNLIRADSHDLRTLDQVKTVIDHRMIDFLFIDGDHTYEGVKKDFNMYSSLVTKGGIIAFHDIVEHPPKTGCDVYKFWNEIKNNYEYYEFIENIEQGWAGIGLIRF